MVSLQCAKIIPGTTKNKATTRKLTKGAMENTDTPPSMSSAVNGKKTASVGST